MNNSAPLYLKDPKECTDEEYKNFYRETFMDFNEPLFWIHLNMEYPFRLKGILYFPQVKKQQVQLEKGQVKLYCNQVFIADNIKEVIPEFLMLLNGVIDCPDIPLNVSRSFLQNDKQVQKISKHITKKVADKLTALFNNEREHYEECWKDISTFIKFGCLKDNDFYEKVEKIIIFKNLDGKYKPLSEYHTNSNGHKSWCVACSNAYAKEYAKIKKQEERPIVKITEISHGDAIATTKTYTTNSNGLITITPPSAVGTYSVTISSATPHVTATTIKKTATVKKAPVKVKAYKVSEYKGFKITLKAKVTSQGKKVNEGTV
jgi:molecular chaperone HtpG